jgi:predicted nucleic acid-binding protein
VPSCLSLFQIERLGLKGILRDWEAILHAIHSVTAVVWLDRAILSQAARLSRGLGIPALDSMILASLVSHNVNEIYTTDSDLLAYQSKDVVVRNLRKH